MADPVSLALGIAPLCVEAIKGCRWIMSKVRTYKRFSTELGRLRSKLEVQIELFRDECEFMLADPFDESTATSMLDDTDREDWSSDGLEDKLKEHLSGKYDSYRAILQDICETIGELKKAFEKVDEYSADETPSVKGSIQVVMTSLFKMSKFQQDIANLGELVSMLRKLRKSARRKKLLPSPKKVLSKEFREVRRCTASLHTVFSQYWSCKNALHTRHIFSLLINPAVGDEIELKAIVWNDVARDGHTPAENISGTPLRIICHDIQVQHDQHSLPPSKPSTLSVQNSEPGQPPAKYAKIEAPNGEKRLRVYRSSRRRITRRRKDEVDASGSNQSTAAENLALCSSVCSKIAQTLTVAATNTTAGYFEIPDDFRFAFSRLEDRTLLSMLNSKSRFDSLPLSQVFSRPLHENISMIDQLRLALALARATLHFWSTPWWADYWRLEDLRFEQASQSLSECVSTIHLALGQDHAAPAPTLGENTQTTDAILKNELDRATLVHGIRNMNLHCLGVALLQIGRWVAVPADDVERVRRLSALPSPLGPRYGKMTEQCLECDFGVGKDLRNPRLQAALYDSVIRELEKMIEVLCLEDEESI